VVKIKKTFFVTLFVISAFLLGVIFGSSISTSKLSSLENSFNELELGLKNLELQNAYLTTFNKTLSCSFLRQELAGILADVDNFIYALEQSKQNNEITTEIEKKYVLAVARHWILMEKIKKECGENKTTVLYFHTPDKDPIAGYCLSKIKEQDSENFLVFPLRTDLNVSIVSVLQKVYDVKAQPAIIFNDTQRFEGLINENGFKEFCCEKTNISIC